MAWPQGAIPFDVDWLIDVGRALNAAASAGRSVDMAQAHDTVRTLAAYVASLPVADQAVIARRLVAELARRKQFTASVAPRVSG